MKLFLSKPISERAVAFGRTCREKFEPGRDTAVTVEMPLRP